MRVVLDLDGDEMEAFVERQGETLKLVVEGESFEARLGEGGVVNLGGRTYQVKVGERAVSIDGREAAFRIVDFQASVGAGGAAGGARGARVKPPMPGKIVSLSVEEGQEVKQGQVLLILEAMKMQNEIPAPSAGVIKKLHVKPGQNVEAKDVLVEIE